MPGSLPQQTVAFLVSPSADHLTVENTFFESYYANIMTAGADGLATSSASVLASPAPTTSAVRLSTVVGVSVGMMMAVLLPPRTILMNAPCPTWAIRVGR